MDDQFFFINFHSVIDIERRDPGWSVFNYSPRRKTSMDTIYMLTDSIFPTHNNIINMQWRSVIGDNASTSLDIRTQDE